MVLDLDLAKTRMRGALVTRVAERCSHRLSGSEVVYVQYLDVKPGLCQKVDR